MVPEMDPQGQVLLIFTALDESWSDVSGFFFKKMWGCECGEGDWGVTRQECEFSWTDSMQPDFAFSSSAAVFRK